MARKLKTDNPSKEGESAKFIVGYSSERPFAQAPAESIFYEKDTGDRYRLNDNGTWDLIDNIHQ